MAVAEAVRAGSLIATLALAQTGRLTLSWLALLGFAGACGTVAYSVTAPSLVPSLVPPEGLATANAQLELARTAAFVGGPAVANTAFFVLQAVYVPYAVHHLASPRPRWASRSAPTGWAWCWARSWPAA